MSKLREAWENSALLMDWCERMDTAITEAEETIARLTRERDEARAKLFPYTDATEIRGFSWNGLYIIGDEASVKTVNTAIHHALQIEEYRAAFKQREEVLTRERDEAREKALDEAAAKVMANVERMTGAIDAYYLDGLRWAAAAILLLKGDKP